MKRILTIGALALTGLMLAGCGGGSDSKSVEGSFVGEVEGTSALLGVVTDGERVRAYACDGKGIARWFSGRGEDGKLDLRAGGLRLQATLTASGGAGTLTLKDGTSRSFRLQSVGGKAGLYQGTATYEGVRYLGRWVVAEDGTQTGRLASVVSRNEAQSVTIPVYNDLAAAKLDLRAASPVAQLAAPGGGTFEMEAKAVSLTPDVGESVVGSMTE